MRLQRSQSFFRGRELVRLMTMLVMLLVVALLMLRRASLRRGVGWRRTTWRTKVELTRCRPAASLNRRLWRVTAAKPVVDTKVAAPPSGPTDEDDEERAAAIEEFQAVSDGELAIQPEDMFAYRRVWSWVLNQSLEQMRARSRPAPPLNDLMQEPAVHRGELVRLKLNIRRVLKYDKQDERIGVKTVYELWGWNDNTQGWLYVVVTPELPPGMHVGEEQGVAVTLYGYFFNVLGYEAAGAKPQDRPLKAPLFIGRLATRDVPVQKPRSDFDSQFIWIALGVLFVGYLGLRFWLRRPRGLIVPPISPSKGREANDWLEDAEDGGLAGDRSKDSRPNDDNDLDFLDRRES